MFKRLLELFLSVLPSRRRAIEQDEEGTERSQEDTNPDQTPTEPRRKGIPMQLHWIMLQGRDMRAQMFAQLLAGGLTWHGASYIVVASFPREGVEPDQVLAGLKVYFEQGPFDFDVHLAGQLNTPPAFQVLLTTKRPLKLVRPEKVIDIPEGCQIQVFEDGTALLGSMKSLGA